MWDYSRLYCKAWKYSLLKVSWKVAGEGNNKVGFFGGPSEPCSFDEDAQHEIGHKALPRLWVVEDTTLAQSPEMSARCRRWQNFHKRGEKLLSTDYGWLWHLDMWSLWAHQTVTPLPDYSSGSLCIINRKLEIGFGLENENTGWFPVFCCLFKKYVENDLSSPI